MGFRVPLTDQSGNCHKYDVTGSVTITPSLHSIYQDIDHDNSHD